MVANSPISASASPHFFAQARKHWFTVRATDPNEAFRERTIRGMVPVLAGFFLVTIIFGLVTHQFDNPNIVFGISLIMGASVVAVAFNRINIAALLVFMFPVAAAIVALYIWGYLSTAGIVLCYFSVLFGAIVLSRRLTIFLPFGMIIIYGLIAKAAGPNGSATSAPAGPIQQTVEMAILTLIFFGLGYYLLNEFEHRRVRLTALIESLEERVAERTRDLTVAANVSQQVTQVLDMDELLPKLTELTRSSFNLYHVSIFLRDEATDTLQLKAGSGEAGRQMVALHKQFGLIDHGLVPFAGRKRQAQIINDVRLSTEHQVNPILPNTLSEAALPMSIGSRLIGVLDLQSEQADKFNPDDIKVLTTLAEQIAIAVRNAQLFADANQARKEAEQANIVKSQFLASMSHELRTPLNAILNFTQFVSTGVLGTVNADQIDMLGKVVQSGQHLLSLINDVLDISKIEAGALKLFVEANVDLYHEASSVVDTAQSLIGKKPITLTFDAVDDLPLIVGDKRRIRQIMLNLVSNACKFTEKGSIRIELKLDQQAVLFAVHDTGPGIAPEDAALVFEVFRQSSTGLHQGEGTGLGLPISQRLAEAHGGRLWLQSVPGQGASFFVTLPVNSAQLQSSIMISQEKRYAV
jgi:signal transduction histidine kinase